MHKKAYDIGQQLGNTSFASTHQQFLIVRQLHAGTNLLDLKEELEFNIKTIEQYCSFPVVGMKLRYYYEAVLTLIGEESSSLSIKQDEGSHHGQELAFVESKMMWLVYLGYYDRARHMALRWKLLSGDNQAKQVKFREIYVNFYYGLSDIALRRQKNVKRKKVPEKEWLNVVINAAECSEWNFQNKASLLLAEKLSSSSKHEKAEVHYMKAIEESRSSHFVHEEGLACELAGMHYGRRGDITKAKELFQQAENCYETWGSAAKSRQVQKKIKSINLKQP